MLQDIWFSFLAATVLAYLAQWTRQPLVLAYIGAGVLLGPIGFKMVKDPEAVQTLADLGLAFMLFIVGLEMDVTKMIAIGKRATPIMLVQVAGCIAMGALGAMALGFQGLEIFYISVALSLSSTMVAVKLLTDRAEAETTHGQIGMGVSLMQDLVALAVLAIQPGLKGTTAVTPVVDAGQAAVDAGQAVLTAGEVATASPWLVGVFMLVKGCGLVAGAVLVSRFLLPLLFRFVAKAPEVMLLTALSWCFLVCTAAAMLGFSVALGALIAGVSIAALPYSLDVIAKIRGLRAFFVTLFFVALGMLLQMPPLNIILAAFALSAVAIVGRIATVWPMARVLRLTPRVGMLSAIYLCPVSEFGVILAMLGANKYGHVSSDITSLVVMALIITSVATTYMIKYSQWIAAKFVPKASTTEADHSKASVMVHDGAPAAVMLIGCFRVGSSLVHELRQAYIDFKVVDFSQHVNERLNKLGVNTVYGDISHMDTLEHAGVDKASILICSISDDHLRGADNMRLMQILRKLNPTAKIIVTSDSIDGASRLYQAGADYVTVPRVLLARHLVEIISEIGAGELDERKQMEMDHLPQRVEVVR